MKNNLQNRHKIALEKFIIKYKKNPNVIGILVSGSNVHSKPDKNSDLDVYIILNRANFRERGNTWIDGVEIEYFMNPVSFIRKKYFFEERMGKTSPSTAHMFSNSIILYQKGKLLDSLIKEARDILSKKLPEFSKIEIEQNKYFIDDLRKDLEDVFEKDDFFAFGIIANELLNKCLEVFYKIKRRSKQKNKRILEDLSRLDRNFAKIFSEAIMENDRRKKFSKINEVVR